MFPDFVAFVALLNDHKVRYLVIGGYAVGLHARPRATKDLDVWIDRTDANARRVISALRAFFGSAVSCVTMPKLMNPRTVLVLGVPPIRIDILTQMDGPKTFRAAWAKRVTTRWAGVDANFLSAEDLILAKIASGRPQDLVDVAELQAARMRRKGR